MVAISKRRHSWETPLFRTTSRAGKRLTAHTLAGLTTALLVALVAGCAGPSSGRIVENQQGGPTADTTGLALLNHSGAQSPTTAWQITEFGSLDQGFPTKYTGVADPKELEDRCVPTTTPLSALPASTTGKQRLNRTIAVRRLAQSCIHNGQPNTPDELGILDAGTFTPIPLTRPAPTGPTPTQPTPTIVTAAANNETVTWIESELNYGPTQWRIFSAPLTGGQITLLGSIDDVIWDVNYTSLGPASRPRMEIFGNRVYFNAIVHRYAKPSAPISVSDNGFHYLDTLSAVYSSPLDSPGMVAEATDTSQFLATAHGLTLMPSAAAWLYGGNYDGTTGTQEGYFPLQVITVQDNEVHEIARELKPRLTTFLGYVAATDDHIIFTRGRTVFLYSISDDTFTSFTNTVPAPTASPNASPGASPSSGSTPSPTPTAQLPPAVAALIGDDVPRIMWLAATNNYVVWTERAPGLVPTSLNVLDVAHRKVWQSVSEADPEVALIGSALTWWEGAEGQRKQRVVELGGN